MTITKEFLSGSTNGRQIAVAATSSGAADTIHTTPAGTASKDEVWLFATNISAAAVTLTLLFGGTSTSDQMAISIPANSTLQIVPGVPLNNGLIVKAFAGTTAVINLSGFVNRITP